MTVTFSAKAFLHTKRRKTYCWFRFRWFIAGKTRHFWKVQGAFNVGCLYAGSNWWMAPGNGRWNSKCRQLACIAFVRTILAKSRWSSAGKWWTHGLRPAEQIVWGCQDTSFVSIYFPSTRDKTKNAIFLELLPEIRVLPSIRSHIKKICSIYHSDF